MKDAFIFTEEDIKELDRFYNNIPYGFCIIKVTSDESSVDARFAYVNDNLANMLSSRREDVINTSYKEVFSVVDEDWLWQFVSIEQKDFKLEKTRFVPEVGRYLNASMYKYDTGLVGSMIKDVSEERIKMLSNTKNAYREIYFINLRENSYFMIYPDYASSKDMGDYRKAIEEHIKSGRIYGEDEANVRKFLDPDNVIEGLANRDIIEYRYRRRYNDNVEWCLNSFVIDERYKGVPATAILMIRSIDEVLKREMEQQALVEEALAQAESANKTKSQFLSNMSHDIRTPMNAIIGFTSMARRNSEDIGKVEDYLDKIESSSKHLLSIINDILDVSKIENGKMRFSEHRCSLKEVVESYKAMVIPQIIEHNHDFKVTFDIIHDRVYLDSIKLKQVLVNLTSNSIKYTPDGGAISLRIKEHVGDVDKFGQYEICIADNGIGISEADIEHLFEPFFRSVNERNENTEGTGLGLTICKSIVELAGGTLECKSKLGKGTEFTISVPMRIDEDGYENAKKCAKNSCELMDKSKCLVIGKTALIVDDNTYNRELLKEILEDEQMKVVEARNGSEAVEIIRNMNKGDIDVVLMDVRMPVMNGYEASKTIRALEDEEKSNIPIIAMTANAFAEDKKEAIRNGMNGHIAKPIDIDTIAGLIAVNAGWK